MAQARADAQTLTDRLAEIVGADHVLTDAESRSLYAQDIFTRGMPAFAVVQPGTTAELAAVVAAATSLG
ncbi:MAG: FAD-binding oxidoreductase, partial [Gammaproteobacteria bacterium]|nr:FAD-binding oxidoreductase [Gammaproteobacteria bacterium]